MTRERPAGSLVEALCTFGASGLMYERFADGRIPPSGSLMLASIMRCPSLISCGPRRIASLLMATVASAIIFSSPQPADAQVSSFSVAEEPAAVQVQSTADKPGAPGSQPHSGQPSVVPTRPTGPPGSTKPGAPSQGKPGPPGDSKAPGQQKPQPKGEEDQDSDVLKRPSEPTTPPNPEELNVRPDEDGIVHFQFQGQAWPDVLEWLAAVSGMSVDWQQLPNDYINISTQRGYTLEETRDILNRLLLDRGFTLLQENEFLTVCKCDQLNTSLVPRVSVEQLDELLPHRFVKVLFRLDWLLAEEAVKELQPLLSKNGKLLPLSSTNRIEAIDAVANLREISHLLKEEQLPADEQTRLVREFVLKYARADELREPLSEFMGVTSSPAGMPPGMSTSQMRAQQKAMMQMQQQMQQRMQQQQQQQNRPGQMPMSMQKSAEKPIRFLVNRRRNSILVQAPPDKMAIVAEAIQLLDVPSTGSTSLQGLLGRMQVYRMTQLDPEKLVKSLVELGNLDPSTRLEVDEDHRAIIAYATPADHFTIQSIIEKLDGSARRVEVISLRKLAADEVAGTIQYLMVGARQEDTSNRSRYMGYSSYYDSYRRRNDNESEDAFRVDADVVNNRLLIRANDVELEEVISILVKLGEMPRSDQADNLTRVLDLGSGQESKALLDELKRRWQSISPHPLVLPPGAENAAPRPEATGKQPAPAKEAALSRPPANQQPAVIRTAQFQSTVSAEAFPTQPGEARPPNAATADSGPDPAGQPPPDAAQDAAQDRSGHPAPAPIKLELRPNGQLLISSSDPRALDQFEQFVLSLVPPRKDFEVFTLEYASASWVALNLEDFFEEEDEADGGRQGRMLGWMYGIPSAGNADDRQRSLSKRRPLKFISDLDTNTILVQGADADQLATIAELIELYDVPEPTTSQASRITKLFQIRFSKASIVAETVKDAYRDLLSANDKSLQKGKGDQGSQRNGSGRTFITPFGLGDDSQERERTSIRFKGKLSIGIDDLSNTLLVSAEGESLMQVIGDMIEALDEAAQPVSQVQVVKLQAGTDGTRLQKVLSKVLGKTPDAPQSADRPAGQVPGRPDGMPNSNMPTAKAESRPSRGR